MRKLHQLLHDRMVTLGTLTNQSDIQKQTAHDGLVFSACLSMIRYSIAKKAADEPAKVAMRKHAGEPPFSALIASAVPAQAPRPHLRWRPSTQPQPAGPAVVWRPPQSRGEGT
jgi:hypothetical protein